MSSSSTDRRLGLTGGVAVKAPCRCGSTANLTLSGLQTVDGVVLVSGDRVLVKNQTDGTQNGIYVADTSSWTRDLDFDGTNDIVRGTLIYVNDGNANLSTFWVVTTLDPIIPGTTSLSFFVINDAIAGVSALMQLVLAATTQAAAASLLGVPLISAMTSAIAVVAAASIPEALAAAKGDVIAATAAGVFSKLGIGSDLALLRADSSQTTGLVWGTPGQIIFPGTQNASANVNTLDDYEEGTWTPNVGGSASYTTQEGTYVKIGRLVFVQAQMVINVIGTGSTSTISGFPFAAQATGFFPLVVSNSTFAINVMSVAAVLNIASSQTATMYGRTAASVSDAIVAVFGNSTQVNIGGCYITAA